MSRFDDKIKKVQQ